MRKRVIIAFILAIFLFSAYAEEVKISSEVYDEARDEDVKVIIKTVGEIEGIDEGKIKHVFNDSVSAELNIEDLKKLEENEDISEVLLVNERKLFLIDSVPLVNGTKTNNLAVNGLNLTGAGQTICIIDSGVNYTHPDLGGCYGDNNLSSTCKVWGGIDYCADNSACSTTDSIPDDVHGHGTHVAGIIAANGNKKGVAPESRIISIKACSSSGLCADDDIKAGIDWCVTNSKTYNISVISMSLGGGLYTDYCDNEGDSLGITGSINNAVGNNISVVVASGNDGSTTGISFPACVRNSTAVGSVRKDGITIDYNRNSIVKLVAPGFLISSTWLTGSATGSGTSMATPHVSAAVAIINQYGKATGQNKSVNEIRDALILTGKSVSDSGSGLSYSLIDVYKAVISFDYNAPEVLLLSPANNSLENDGNISFTCNASDISLRNMSFYLWNSSSVYNESAVNISGGNYLFSYNISSIAEGEYQWGCAYRDENNNVGTKNYSITIGNFSVSLASPNNGLSTNSNQSFTCEGSSFNSLANVTFYIWNSTGLENTEEREITGRSNSTVFYYNFSKEGNYDWNCIFFNNISESKLSTNSSVLYDVTSPNINLTSPSESANSGTISFEYNITDNYNADSCGLIVNGENRGNSSANLNLINSFSLSLGDGSYNWMVNCTDDAGNYASSATRTLSLSTPVPASSSSSGSSSSGGGGGSSGGSSTSSSGSAVVKKTIPKNNTNTEQNRTMRLQNETETIEGGNSITGEAVKEQSFGSDFKIPYIGAVGVLAIGILSYIIFRPKDKVKKKKRVEKEFY